LVLFIVSLTTSPTIQPIIEPKPALEYQFAVIPQLPVAHPIKYQYEKPPIAPIIETIIESL
jgi:hypothetical protein